MIFGKKRSEVNEATKHVVVDLLAMILINSSSKFLVYNLIDTEVFGHSAFTSVAEVVQYKVDAIPQHPQVRSLILITDL